MFINESQRKGLLKSSNNVSPHGVDKSIYLIVARTRMCYRRHSFTRHDVSIEGNMPDTLRQHISVGWVKYISREFHEQTYAGLVPSVVYSS